MFHFLNWFSYLNVIALRPALCPEPKTTAADPTAHAAAAADCSHYLPSIKFISVSSRLAVKEIRQFKETINKER